MTAKDTAAGALKAAKDKTVYAGKKLGSAISITFSATNIIGGGVFTGVGSLVLYAKVFPSLEAFHLLLIGFLTGSAFSAMIAQKHSKIENLEEKIEHVEDSSEKGFQIP